MALLVLTSPNDYVMRSRDLRRATPPRTPTAVIVRGRQSANSCRRSARFDIIDVWGSMRGARLAVFMALLAVVVATLVPGLASGRSYFKPCARHGRPASFNAWWLGPRFEGLPVESGPAYGCYDPDGRPTRLHYVTLSYGVCSGQCGPPPLTVVTKPACDSNLSLYDRWARPSPSFDPLRVRAASAMAIGVDPITDGSGISTGRRPWLEVYTGDLTVAIYGSDAARRLRAAKALRALGVVRATAKRMPNLPSPVPGHHGNSGLWASLHEYQDGGWDSMHR